jgi:hypothetical protein
MLQRRFTDEDGLLYFFDKRDKSRCVRATSPKNIFVERDIYSTKNADGSKDASLESYYSLIEGEANAVIEKTVNAARRNSAPRLARSEKSDLDEFVHHLWKRAPDFFSEAWTTGDAERSIKSTTEEIERQHGPLAPELVEALGDPAIRARLEQNARVGALRNPGPLLGNELARRGLIVARIAVQAKSFVLGSLPVVELPRFGFAEHLQEGPEIWIALSWDVAISYAAPVGQEAFMPISEERRIRAFNKAAFNRVRSLRVGRAPL